MNTYQRDFPIDDRPETWHDKQAQEDALDALAANDLQELSRIFREARGLSLYRIMRDIIKEKL